MKITRIRIFKTDLPYVGGAYVWGAGNAIEVAKASVVVIDTDAGLQGCGEFTPCGENYMIAHFAASTPAEYLQNTTDLMNYNTRSTGIGGAWAEGGNLYAPDEPGLGVTADFDSLGAPVSEYRI